MRATLSCSFRGVSLAALGLLVGSPASSQESSLFQELGVFVVQGASHHVELPSPRGLGIASQWGIGDHWLARLSLQRSRDRSSKRGIVCKLYSPRIGCGEEMTETSVTLGGVRAGLLRSVRLGPDVRLALGGGLSFNQVKARSWGEEGGRADLLQPTGGQIGYLGLFSVSVSPFARIPLGISGSLNAHWVGFTSCAAEGSEEYDPFCGTGSFREIELGLVYYFF
jgi:hypothetical protein